jgi:hypothetical protein
VHLGKTIQGEFAYDPRSQTPGLAPSLPYFPHLTQEQFVPLRRAVSITDESRAEMLARQHVRRQRRQQALAVRRDDAFAEIARDLRTDHQFLDEVFFVALGHRAGRRIGEGEAPFMGDGKLSVLGFLVRPRPFFLLAVAWRRRQRLFQKAGSDLGARLLPFEKGDLIAKLLHGFFELTNPILLRADDREQRFNQGSALLQRNFRK